MRERPTPSVFSLAKEQADRAEAGTGRAGLKPGGVEATVEDEDSEEEEGPF